MKTNTDLAKFLALLSEAGYAPTVAEAAGVTAIILPSWTIFFDDLGRYWYMERTRVDE